MIGLIDAAELVAVPGADENDELYSPAEKVTAMTPAAGYDDALEESVVGYLKKKFDAHKHPRWPKGTPDAGEFMKVGQWFHADGKDWQIVNLAGGKVTAAEASGKEVAAEHRVFDAKSSAVDGPGVAVPGIKPSEPRMFDRHTSPIVVPYVLPETHDASVAVHSASKLKAEDWKRFGVDDQTYYNEVMDRFGAWSASKSKTLMAEVMDQYDHEVQAAVAQAFQGNKGGTGFWPSGAGQWLNLAFLLKQFGAVTYGSDYEVQSTNQGKVKLAWEKYQKIKAAFDDISEVTHWDLYNRTRSPDIVLFHGGGGTNPGANYKTDLITGKHAIYAGFSQSYSLSGATSWGSTVIATPTAIRHVAMSYYTPVPGGSSSWGEKEIAVSARMKVDERSVVFNSSSYNTSGAASTAIGQMLHGHTDSSPSGGWLIEKLKDVWAGKSDIPIPPPPFQKTPINAGGKSYVDLKPAVAKAAIETGMAAKYKSEDGTKENAVGKIDGMGLKPGDFIEGQQGTRYVIIEDPDDPSNGLRYVKIGNAHGPVGAISYAKSYQFNASAGKDFFRLDAHIEIPKEKKIGFTPFSQEQYGKLVKGGKTKLAELPAGAMFSEDGEGFKVIGAMGGTVQFQSLDTGKEFTGNPLFGAVPLVPQEGFVPPEPTFEDGTPAGPYKPKVGELVLVGELGGKMQLGTYYGMDGEHAKVSIPLLGETNVYAHALHKFESWSPESVEPGDIFAHAGKKYTVTSLLKNGTVRAKPQGGGGVEKFTKAQMTERLLAGRVFRPSGYVIDSKMKAKDLDVGQLISGSGAKVRPYVVVSSFDKDIRAVNLESGEMVKLSPNKSWHVLTEADLTPKEEGKPASPPPPASTVPQQPGDFVALGSLDVGDSFTVFNGGAADGMTQYVTQKLDDGTIYVGAQPDIVGIKIEPGKAATMVVKPYDKPADPVDPSNFDATQYTGTSGSAWNAVWPDDPTTTGDEVILLADAEPGTVFLSAKGLPMMLKSNKPKHGATAIALHNGKTVKNIDKDKGFKKLVPKAEAPFDYDSLALGDKVMLEKLKGGDWFTTPGGNLWLVKSVHPGLDVVAQPVVATHADGSVALGVDQLFGPGEVVDFHAHLANGPKVAGSKVKKDSLPDVNPPVGLSFKLFVNDEAQDPTYTVSAVAPDGTITLSWTHPSTGENSSLEYPPENWKSNVDDSWTPVEVKMPAGAENEPEVTAAPVSIVLVPLGAYLKTKNGAIWQKGAGSNAATLIEPGAGNTPSSVGNEMELPSTAMVEILDLPDGPKPAQFVTYKGAKGFWVAQLGNTTPPESAAAYYQSQEEAEAVAAEWNAEAASIGAKHAPDVPTTVPTNAPDLGSLPDAVEELGYMTYLHPKSGSKKYPQIKEMLPGTYFKDKSGLKWIVKGESGTGNTVIANALGELYQIDPNLRGSVSEVPFFKDVSKPVGDDPIAAAEQALYAGLVPSTGAIGTVQLKDLTSGDWFEALGGKGLWQVTTGVGSVSGSVYAKNLKGEGKWFPEGYYPKMVPASANADEPGGVHLEPDDGPAMVENFEVSFGELDVGDKFEADGSLYEKTGDGDGEIEAYHPDSGMMETFPSDGLPDKVENLFPADAKAGLGKKVGDSFDMVGQMPLGSKVETHDGVLELTSFEDGSAVFTGVATGDQVVLGQAAAPPSHWKFAAVASGRKKSGGVWVDNTTATKLSDLPEGAQYTITGYNHTVLIKSIKDGKVELVDVEDDVETPDTSVTVEQSDLETAQLPKAYKLPEHGSSGGTGFVTGEKYTASDLPPGSIVQSGSNDFGSNEVISKNGLVMKWDQPIPGSDHWPVVYKGPPSGPAEPEVLLNILPGDATITTKVPLSQWIAVMKTASPEQVKIGVGNLNDEELSLVAAEADSTPGASAVSIAVAVEQETRAKVTQVLKDVVPDSSGHMTTEEALKAGFYVMGSGKLPAGEFAAFEMARRPNGQLVYKMLADSPTWYVLGTDKKAQIKAQTKLTPVGLPMPQGELEDGGHAKIGEIPIGGMFSHKGFDFMVIARGEDGSHIKRLEVPDEPAVIMFNSPQHEQISVMTRKEKPSEVSPDDVTLSDPVEIQNVPVGGRFKVFGESWEVESADVGAVLLKNLGTGLYSEATFDAEGDYEGMEPVDSPDTEAPGYGIEGWIGPQPDGMVAKFDELPIGQEFEAHGAMWKKVGGSTAEITAITDHNQLAPLGFKQMMVGEEVELHDRPSAAGVPPGAETDSFAALGFGAYFKWWGGIWQKGGGGKAKLVAYDQDSPVNVIPGESIGTLKGGFQDKEVVWMKAEDAHAQMSGVPIDAEPLPEGLEAVWTPDLKPGDVFVDAPEDDPATMGWLVTDIGGNYVEAIAVAGGGSKGTPKSWAKPMFKVFGPAPPGGFDVGQQVQIASGGVAPPKSGTVVPSKPNDQAAGLVTVIVPNKTGGKNYGMKPENLTQLESLDPAKSVVHHVTELEVGDQYETKQFGLTWEVTARDGEHADIKVVAADPKKSQGIGVGYEQSIDGPIDVMVTKAQGPKAGSTAPAEDSENVAFFQQLKNGDKALLVGGPGKSVGAPPEVVTVVDNQIAGLDVMVKDSGGVEFPASEGDLAPLPTTTFDKIPVGAKFKWKTGKVTWLKKSDADSANAEQVEIGSGGYGTPGTVGLFSPTDKDLVIVEPPAQADPLKPYLHPKSGKHKYPQVGDQPPGTKFTDKAHGDYVVISHVGDQTFFEDADGNQFATGKKTRVKLVDGGGAVQESVVRRRVRFTSGGSVLVGA